MKRRPKGLIERFYSRAGDDQEQVFQLVKEDNKYYIKRGTYTLFVIEEEQKALKGFKSLREKWSIE